MDILLTDEKTENYNALDHKPTPFGCETVERSPDVLQLDFDSKLIPSDLPNRLSIMKNQGINAVGVQRWRSKSGNLHVQVKFDQEFTPEQAVFFQLLLGSDPIRETLNIRRIQSGITPASVLHRPSESKISDIDLTTWE